MPLHRLFFYLTIILLPTQLGKHFWPDWAFVVGRRVDYLSPTLFLTDITIVLTLFFYIFSFKKFHLFQNLKLHSLAGLVALVGLVGLNMFFAASPPVAFYKWLKLLEFGLFGVYIIKTKPDVRNILIGLSIAVFYSSLIAIAQFFLQHSLGGILWFFGERTFDITTGGIARIQILPFSILHSKFLIFNSGELLRPYATFPHPNVLGGFLAIMLPLLIYTSINDKVINNKIKIFQWITILLGFFALVLTFSRSAWVVGIIGVMFVMLYKFYTMKKSKPKSFLLVKLVALVGLVGFSIPYFQTLTPVSESVYVRTELNSAAIKMIFPNLRSPLSDFRHLIFGVGLGNYLVELPKYYPHREIFFLQPVHNIYILLLSETGIIGLGLFLFFLWNVVKKRKKDALFFCLFISLSLYLLLGIIDHYPLTTQQGQLLLTLLISLSLL